MAKSVVVTVLPGTATVQASLTASFTASVANDPKNEGTSWTLSGAGCSGAACGSLSGTTSASGGAMAAKAFKSLEQAQDALCPKHRVIEPDPKAARVYEQLYALYRELYLGFGQPDAAAISVGRVLPTLRKIAASARGDA